MAPQKYKILFNLQLFAADFLEIRSECFKKNVHEASLHRHFSRSAKPKTVDCSLLPYIPVHGVIHLKHPFREFGFGIGDELFGHLTIESVCHRAGNGAKRVGIAT